MHDLRRVLAPVALVFTMLALSQLGCRNKVGDPCTGDGAACGDRATQLTCEGGHWVAKSCKGPAGCNATGGKVTCDMSANADGDPCPHQNEGQGTCSADRSSAILCKGGASQVETCRGPDRCLVKDGQVICDHTVAQPGERCGNGVSGCTMDGKRFLDCKDGRFVDAIACKGPGGCTRSGGNAVCDTSIGDVGDACRGGGSSCGSDGKTFLGCENATLTLKSQCRGPEGCRIQGNQVTCDSSVSEAGDACTGEGAACSVDHKAMLTCKGGKFEVTARCSRCVQQGENITCR